MTARPGIDFPGVGVGLVIGRADGLVLLYRRMNAPEAGHWNIVGGKVDTMERSAEAARREAEEETGLRIGKVDFLCLAEEIFPAEQHHWISLIYQTEDFSGEPRLTEPDKLTDFGWFSPELPPAPLSVFARRAFLSLQRA